MTGRNDPLYTEFAPAERSSPDEIERQARLFVDMGLLHQFLDAIPTALMVLNKNRQIVFANRPLIQATGQDSQQALLGLRPGETLGCIHSATHVGGCGTTRFCRECGAVRAILSSLSGRQAVEECRVIRHKDDEQFESLDLRVWTTPLPYEVEQFVVFSLVDIGHEKRRQALEHIFFHDILNTVSTLRLASEMLPKNEPDDQKQLFDAIAISSERLAQEILTQRDLLAAENNELETKATPIHSGEFLQKMIQSASALPAAQGRDIRISPAAAQIEFFSDAVLLGRVILNMIKNAVEASAPDQTVSIDCQAAENQVEFSVHNPNYIPPAVQHQIFQRSFSTKGKGRGLGTYSMKLLSEQYLKGQVSFVSTKENGTTFFARYPFF